MWSAWSSVKSRPSFAPTSLHRISWRLLKHDTAVSTFDGLQDAGLDRRQELDTTRSKIQPFRLEQ